MTQTQDWFPGKDFPDREVWLKIRETKNVAPGRLVFNSKDGPMAIGINNAKRASDRAGSRQNLIRTRHAHYRNRAAA